jgi:hypothetical protein
MNFTPFNEEQICYLLPEERAGVAFPMESGTLTETLSPAIHRHRTYYRRI